MLKVLSTYKVERTHTYIGCPNIIQIQSFKTVNDKHYTLKEMCNSVGLTIFSQNPKQFFRCQNVNSHSTFYYL